jgi:hypothetical protein
VSGGIDAPDRQAAQMRSSTCAKKSEPFMLAAGDCEVTLKTSKGCDEFTYAYLIATDSGSSASGDGAR